MTQSAAIRSELRLQPPDVLYEATDLAAFGRKANGWDVDSLGADDVAVVNTGVPDETGNVALVSIGHSFAVTAFSWDGGQRRPFATQGGHTDFAPRNELQAGLLRYLEGAYDHVSYERVCSAAGLVDIYRYLRDGNGSGPELDATAITDAALERTDGTCSWALDLMISIYGAAVGNAALLLMATGGVYLGGDLAPRILPRMLEGGFMRAFLDKGPVRPMMELIPVYAIRTAPSRSADPNVRRRPVEMTEQLIGAER
jgi:glucokinase